MLFRCLLLKIFVVFGTLLLLFIVAFNYLTNWTQSIMEDKPRENYISSKNIEQSKNEGYWVATFIENREKYNAEVEIDSLSINEVWIEENRISNNEISNSGQYDYILNLLFNSVTDENLHKFRLIQTPKFINYSNSEVEYPDAHPRIRYLLKYSLDTVKLEVLERNPNDTLAWLTEKAIDTIVLVKTDIIKDKNKVIN